MSKVAKNDWTGSINGSAYSTASSDAITPTSGNVWIAITMLSAITVIIRIISRSLKSRASVWRNLAGNC